MKNTKREVKKEKKKEFEGQPCVFCGDVKWWDLNDWGFVDLDEKIFVCRRCNKIAHKIYDTL